MTTVVQDVEDGSCLSVLKPARTNLGARAFAKFMREYKQMLPVPLSTAAPGQQKRDGRNRAVFKEAWRRLPATARQKYYDDVSTSCNLSQQKKKSLVVGGKKPRKNCKDRKVASVQNCSSNSVVEIEDDPFEIFRDAPPPNSV